MHEHRSLRERFIWYSVVGLCICYLYLNYVNRHKHRGLERWTFKRRPPTDRPTKNDGSRCRWHHQWWRPERRRSCFAVSRGHMTLAYLFSAEVTLPAKIAFVSICFINKYIAKIDFRLSNVWCLLNRHAKKVAQSMHIHTFYNNVRALARSTQTRDHGRPHPKRMAHLFPHFLTQTDISCLACGGDHG